MSNAQLKVVRTLDDEIQLALIQLKRAEEMVKSAEQELQPLRRRYADRAGERMLPSIERLQREFGR